MQVRTPWRPLAALLCVIALVGAGCGNDDDTTTTGDTGADTEQPDASGDNTASIEMVDYGYVIDGSLQEGWTTFDVTNTGDEYHMIGIGRMKEGVTLEDVTTMLTEGGEEGGGEEAPAEGEEAPADEQSLGEIQLISAQTEEGGEEAPPIEGEEEGGEEGGDPFDALFEEGEDPGPPGGFLAPGESMSMSTDGLAAGTYALICFVESSEGGPHFAQGMINQLTIEESDDPVGEPPEADVTVDVSPESVEMPAELEAGEHTFEVNLSGGEHEFSAIRFVDQDATFEELDEYFATFETDPLPERDELEDGPAVFTGFVFNGTQDPVTYYVTKELTPGRWYIGCGLEEFDEETEEVVRDHAETELQLVTVS